MGSTLSTIRGKVRVNLGETSGQNLYSNTDLNEIIGSSYHKRFLQMVQSGNGYFETYQDVALTSGVDVIDLSALSNTYLRLSQIYKNLPTSRVPIFPSEKRYETQYTANSGGGSYFTDYTYRFRGRLNLILSPVPMVTESASTTTGIRIEYIYVPSFPVSASSDSFTFSDEFSTSFEPLIILDATIKALEVKEISGGISDIDTFRKDRDKLEIDFMNSLKPDEMPQQVVYSGQFYDNIFDNY